MSGEVTVIFQHMKMAQTLISLFLPLSTQVKVCSALLRAHESKRSQVILKVNIGPVF